MADNEFIPREEQLEQEAPVGQTKRKPTKAKSKAKSPKVNVRSWMPKVNMEKVRRTFGIMLILFSFYLFLACLSYLFTWKVDQDRVMSKGLFDFLFEQNAEEVSNWLGKFGAWTSHLLIFRWFGVSSFAFAFLSFIFGVKLVFQISLLPLLQTLKRVVILLVWSSVFLGFFASSINYLGGSFGYYLNEWLALTLGKFGSLTLILVSGYVVMTMLYNINLKAWFEKLRTSPDSEEEEQWNDYATESRTTDIHMINTIEDHEIQEDELSNPVDFSEELEIEFNPELEESEDPSSLIEEQDFEIEFNGDDIIPVVEKGDSSFDVSIAEEEPVIDTENLQSAREAFGAYDPTLDLSSYVLPSIDLLKDYGTSGLSINKEELELNKNRIVETLSHYKIDIARIKATVGPTVTLYEIVPAPGVRISKIKNLEDDIALSLSALGIRIIAPIPGKGTIGIEVPNSKPDMVSMRSLIASEKFQHSDAELPIVMGKTITNETFTFDLTKMPHLLVAGATGQGKSVGLNAILISILYKKHPAQVKFVLIDPKQVELTLYNKIERHFLAKLPGEEEAIITDTSKVVNTLNSLCIEMDDRYALLKDAGVRTIKEYNTKFIDRKLNPEQGHRFLPYIVVLIDEFADLIMTAGKEVEHPIARIAQLARAIGIHLIVATQRPSVNVITGMIKANFPARIAFRVLSKIDSRTILDASGADQLIGRGDMLISTGSDLQRLQCGFVDTPEVEAICAYIGSQRAYPEALLLPEFVGEGSDGGNGVDMDEIDPMFADAARIVVINQQGSASLLQRKLKLGYNRAGRIVDQLEAMGIIGAFQGSKAREVIYSDVESLDEFLRTKGIL
jgi:S-DNA-T family DNA segregation ATPase FtsK/SpoIIIE